MRVLPHEAKNYKLGHSRNEAFGDSEPGLRYFAKRHCTRVDGNGLLSRDHKPVNTHYRLFLHHGFEHRDGMHLNRHLPVGHFSAESLAEDFWYAANHTFKIDLTVHRIELAFSLRMDYEFEPKEHMPRHVAEGLFTQVRVLQETYPKRKVIVKTLMQRPGTPVYDLRPFHRAGFPTLLTSHRPLQTIDPQVDWIDEGRGFPVRYAA